MGKSEGLTSLKQLGKIFLENYWLDSTMRDERILISEDR